ncbi:MAG: hypothetical protein FOGNACKC_01887 [Anaerolineae bacterium]|nr:hypothetical protein [Anaerolineae bacterium]
MITKQQLAVWIQRIPVLRWALVVAVRLFAPKNYVGVMGAIFNDAGHVLMVKHVFRPDYPWGLPGGWVERGESPALAIERELAEELALAIEVKKILFCELQGVEQSTTTPLGLGIAYYCRVSNDGLQHIQQAHSAYEVLQAEWIAPENIKWKLARLHRMAIDLGRQEFQREQQYDAH